MENNPLLVSKEGHVCTLVINRPHKRNALTQDVLAALCRHLEELGRTDDVRAVVLRGKGEQAFKEKRKPDWKGR